MQAEVLQFALPNGMYHSICDNLPPRRHVRVHVNGTVARRKLLEGTLPAWAVILDSVSFTDLDCPQFPPHLRIFGSLSLNGCRLVSKLADDMRIEGSLEIINTPITKLPRRLRVYGGFKLNTTPVKGVPRDLYVRDGITADEYAAASIQRLVGKKPVKWFPKPISINSTAAVKTESEA